MEVSGKTYRGTGLVLDGKNGVIVKDCVFEDIFASSGTAKHAVELKNCRNITIQNCVFRRVNCGIYAVGCSGLVIRNNYCENIQKLRPRGQFVQMNGVKNPVLIERNVVWNEAGKSSSEDLISVYKTSGTANDYITIRENYLRGGYGSTSGSGIMLCDDDGAFQLAEGNILVECGQVGVGVAGGRNGIVRNNIIMSKQTSISNVGIYVMKQQGEKECRDHSVIGNRVSWINKRGTQNPFYQKDVMNLTVENNNFNAIYTEPAIPEGWGIVNGTQPEPTPTPTPTPTPEPTPTLRIETLDLSQVEKIVVYYR